MLSSLLRSNRASWRQIFPQCDVTAGSNIWREALSCVELSVTETVNEGAYILARKIARLRRALPSRNGFAENFEICPFQPLFSVLNTMHNPFPLEPRHQHRAGLIV
jgi:hypothetical protein